MDQYQKMVLHKVQSYCLKPSPTNMTLNQIEEKLGYSVKVIGD